MPFGFVAAGKEETPHFDQPGRGEVVEQIEYFVIVCEIRSCNRQFNFVQYEIPTCQINIRGLPVNDIQRAKEL